VGRLPVHDRVVRALRALPVPVAVHREVAPGDGDDVARPRRLGVGGDVGEEPVGDRRRRVAAVSERVGDGGDAGGGTDVDQRRQMRHVRVDAAVREEAHQVDAPVVVVGVRQRRPDGVVLGEFAGVDGVVDPGIRLLHHPSGADVEVADLAVAHLPLGEADPTPVDDHAAVGAAGDGVVERRRVGRGHGVAPAAVRRRVPVAPGAVIAQSPAVEDHQRCLHTSSESRAA